MVNMVRLVNGVAVAFGLVHQIAAQATCTDCDASEDSAMLQLNELATEASGLSKNKCKDMIEEYQSKWKDLILQISSTYLASPESDNFITAAEEGIATLYGYDVGKGKVSFKPTLAAEFPFRPTAEGALSYFVGYDAIKPKGYSEDGGFAINKGKGWSLVRFENNVTHCPVKKLYTAMGHYYFTSATDPDAGPIKVEYTFGYKDVDGELKITVHHSSLPYA